MDSAHFDWNTCLRESMALLKCFLRALPDDGLRGFQKIVSAHWLPPASMAAPPYVLKGREQKGGDSAGGEASGLWSERIDKGE